MKEKYSMCIKNALHHIIDDKSDTFIGITLNAIIEIVPWKISHSFPKIALVYSLSLMRELFATAHEKVATSAIVA